LELRLGRELSAVVLIDVPDAVLETRLTGRRSCPVCSAMYHVSANPPKREGHCDVEGTDLIVRSDDRREVVRDRLAVYHRETEPIVAHYDKQGCLVRIDGQLPIDGVTAAVLKA